MFVMQFMVRLMCRFLRQRQAWLIPFVLFAVVACTPKNEFPKNDQIGVTYLEQCVDEYVTRNGEFPTKEEFLDANNMKLRELLVSEGFSAEWIDRFFTDSLGKEMDYFKIWPFLKDPVFLGRPKIAMIIASNYLMTHPSFQFTRRGDRLIIVDSTSFLPDSLVVSVDIHLPEILITDSAYYYYGERQPSITSMFKIADSSENVIACELSCGMDYNPINVAYDSPVELIDTLRYYFYRLYFINKGVDKDEPIFVYNHMSSFYRQQIDSIMGMPPILQDLLPVAERDSFLQFKNTYMDLIRNAKIRLHRSNGTIYMNGNPVDETCHLSADSSVILIDLTHNNTYRDLCELMHFMEKATDSESIEVLKGKGFRWKYYFKTDDKLYKAFKK